MDLYTEFCSIAREFAERNVRYVVVGALAMAFYDRPRFTRDIDLLVLPQGVESAAEALAKLGYLRSTEPWTLNDVPLTFHRFIRTEGEDHLLVDVMAGDGEEYRRIVADAVEEPCDGFRVCLARKEDIIWLKGLRGSDQDRVDIERLSDDKA